MNIVYILYTTLFHGHSNLTLPEIKTPRQLGYRGSTRRIEGSR
jgi:hypothetical protein